MPGSGSQRPSDLWQSVKAWGTSHLTSARAAGGAFPGRVEGFLSKIEQKRLDSILNLTNGEAVATVRGGETLLLRRRHWIGVVGRLSGILVAFMLALLLPVLLTAVLVVAGHGVAINAHRGLRNPVGIAVAVVEFIAFFIVFAVAGAAALWLALIGFLMLMAVLVVWMWRVDMMLVTTSCRLIRTCGLSLMRRQAFVPLDSVRATSVSGPYVFGLGSVTFDSASDEDRLLHRFGLIADPNHWAAQVIDRRQTDVPSTE